MEQDKFNENQGGYYKEIGNDFFKRGDYERALENYSKAIVNKDKRLL